MDDVLSTDWDTTSLAAKEIRPRYTAFRPDCIILAYSGIEVATIEVKPLNTNKKLVETDLCKVAEVCKRQLHLRMKVARKSKEFKTFGVVVAGKRVLFTSLNLSTNDGKYKFVQHGEVPLPCFGATGKEMKKFLQIILAFKGCIKQSLPSGEDEKLYLAYLTSTLT